MVPGVPTVQGRAQRPRCLSNQSMGRLCDFVNELNNGAWCAYCAGTYLETSIRSSVEDEEDCSRLRCSRASTASFLASKKDGAQCYLRDKNRATAVLVGQGLAR